MAARREGSSDTLERSNISSLHTDISDSTNKCSDNSVNNNLKDNVKYTPCSAPNSNFIQPQYLPCPCYTLKWNEPCYPSKICKENTKSRWGNFQGKWPKSSCSKMKEWRNNRRNGYYYDDEGIPREKKSIFDKFRNLKNVSGSSRPTEKIEVYYFDHGNSAYYHTTDIPPVLSTERCIEKSNTVATRFWAEIFSYLHIIISFFTTFLLQLIRCLLFSIIRPLTVGVIQLLADYFIKPLLSITFNGIIQPFLILLYNIATSLRDCCEPLAAALGFFIKEMAVLLKACRIVEINNYQKNEDSK